MPPSLTGVQPQVVSASGGDGFYVLGQFQIGQNYQVRVQGTLCQSGIAGQGPQVRSADGKSLLCFAPALALAFASDVQVQAQDGTQASLVGALRVLPPFYASEVFAFRAILPALYDAGPRSMQDLPPPGGA